MTSYWCLLLYLNCLVGKKIIDFCNDALCCKDVLNSFSFLLTHHYIWIVLNTDRITNKKYFLIKLNFVEIGLNTKNYISRKNYNGSISWFTHHYYYILFFIKTIIGTYNEIIIKIPETEQFKKKLIHAEM